jgi:hypothetical protein
MFSACMPRLVEKFTFTGLPVGGGHARDKAVGQFATWVAAPHGLPVQQTRRALAEVDVSGMGIAVHHGVGTRSNADPWDRGTAVSSGANWL